ncbi:MAG: SdiA-regulated domain-containing protein [Actinobacteria bacterium]|nr:SdiA-regulated domain-containing protein [Actinomycetota bacterium]
MGSRSLEIRAVFDVPLLEISGLGQRPRSGARTPEMLAVGDNSFDIVVANLPEPGETPDYRRHDLKGILDSDDAAESSEWEAADGDVTGRVFILQESPGKVFILNPELDELIDTIDLRLDSYEDLEWSNSPNTQAEGLVLLANGHVLVAKEKDPLLLMEFGPAGDEAQGLGPGLLLMSGKEFPTPHGKRPPFELLKAWKLDEETDERINDVSDVAVGPDDRLYLLSDESRCIARIENRVSAAGTSLGTTALWRLPEELEQPEGLILTEDLVPLVAIDKGEPERNLFVLSALQ